MKSVPMILSTAALLALPLSALAGDPSPESKAAYDAACARCHEVGMMGAPVTGEASDWQDRAPIGEASLEHHAEKGLLRGGVDDTARAAAEYMKAVVEAP